MNKSDKNRNYLVVIFEIIIIILGIVGITLATTKLLNDRTVTNLKTDEYNVDYQEHLMELNDVLLKHRNRIALYHSSKEKEKEKEMVKKMNRMK